MNGVYKFYCIFTCGCVISERALKSMQSNSNKCLNCDKAYDDSDLIILNPNEEDLQLNQDKYNNRKAAAIEGWYKKARLAKPRQKGTPMSEATKVLAISEH